MQQLESSMIALITETATNMPADARRAIARETGEHENGTAEIITQAKEAS